MAERRVLALIDNLFFASKLESVARLTGLTVLWAKTSEEALRWLHEQPPDLLVIALREPSDSWEALVRQVKTDPATRDVPVLAFGRHTEGKLFRLARQAGCDLAVTNAQFSEQLGNLLARLLDRPASALDRAAPGQSQAGAT